MSDIVQLDGGGSLSTSSTSDFNDVSEISDFSDYSSSDEDVNSSPIQVTCNSPQDTHYTMTEPPVWFEAYIPRPANLPCTRRTVRRDNKYEKCGMLPSVSVANVRSFFSKARNFVHDIKMRSLSLSLVSETWEKKSKKKHRSERMLQMEGMKLISTPRPSGKRGGGCGIIADLTHYTLDQVDVPNPDNVEMCWGILRP